MPPKKEQITFFSLKKEIESKKFRPIYVLQGDEPYYIDQLQELIINNALTEDEKDFNLTVCYGLDVEMRNVIAACKQYPAMSQYQVVVLREAQNVGKSGNKHQAEMNMLQFYAQKPLESTILVICYKGGTIKENDFTKELKKTTGVVFTSNKIRDYETPRVVRDYCKECNVAIDEKSISMLSEHIGSDLSRLFAELDKLRILTDDKCAITPDLIQNNIGYSKEYNIFELEDALVNRNQLKAYRIVDYFQKNPKNNPLIPVVASLFNFFSNILLIQTAADKSEAGLMEQTNIRSAYRVRKLKEASMQFSKVACVNIISYIRECDVKSKGQGSRQDPYDLFKELVYKIMHS